MAHWRMHHQSNSNYFTFADIMRLSGGKRELVVKIEKAEGAEVEGMEGRDDSVGRVVVKFVGIDKPLVSNVTNNSTLEMITGTPDVASWAGAVVSLVVGRTKRGRKRSDPPPGPGENRKTIEVDCVRVKPAKVAADIAVYGVAGGVAPDFDLDGWRAAIAGCKTTEDLTRVRVELTAAKPPATVGPALRKAIANAEDAIKWSAMTDEQRADAEAAL